MAQRAENEGFRMLDDFVCEAIHDPATPLANPAKQGRNEGMSVVAEILFDAPPASQAGDKQNDSPRRAITVNDAATPLRTGWSSLFLGAAAAVAFSGLVGGVLRAVGAVAGLKDSPDPAEPCKLCGRSDATYLLRCCHSTTCENCLSKMFTPQREDAVAFRCAVCGHIHTEAEAA
jgi:hypothetical protein